MKKQLFLAIFLSLNCTIVFANENQTETVENPANIETQNTQSPIIRNVFDYSSKEVFFKEENNSNPFEIDSGKAQILFFTVSDGTQSAMRTAFICGFSQEVIDADGILHRYLLSHSNQDYLELYFDAQELKNINPFSEKALWLNAALLIEGEFKMKYLCENRDKLKTNNFLLKFASNYIDLLPLVFFERQLVLLQTDEKDSVEEKKITLAICKKLIEYKKRETKNIDIIKDIFESFLEGYQAFGNTSDFSLADYLKLFQVVAKNVTESNSSISRALPAEVVEKIKEICPDQKAIDELTVEKVEALFNWICQQALEKLSV